MHIQSIISGHKKCYHKTSKKRPSLIKCTLLGVNLTLLVVLGSFMIWDYYTTTNANLLEKRYVLQEESSILLRAITQDNLKNDSVKLQQFIDETCSAMQDSISPGHHIAVNIQSVTIQSHVRGQSTPQMLNAMRQAALSKTGTAKTGSETIIVGSSTSSESGISVYVSEYLSNIYKIGRDEVVRRLISIIILGITLAIVLNFVLFKLVSKPLHKMTDAIQLFGRGNFDTRMPETDTYELGLLADEFDQMASDISKAHYEQKRLSVALDARNKELESFIYITSHDLRSPIVNIQGFANELARTIAEIKNSVNATDMPMKPKSSLVSMIDTDINESLRYIKESAQKMHGLIEGLLRLSRVGHAKLNLETIDMNQLMNKITNTMQFQIKEADVSVKIDDLPVCYGDASQLNQLFSNLLSNALKYLDPTRRGLIHISGRKENNMSIYTIKDNGIGIPSSHQSKIFEVFHRVDPGSSVSGEGLGLSIVKRIVERHNGSIGVESQEGIGSVFYITLSTNSDAMIY